MLFKKLAIIVTFLAAILLFFRRGKKVEAELDESQAAEVTSTWSLLNPP
jgi:hypothetical protein